MAARGVCATDDDSTVFTWNELRMSVISLDAAAAAAGELGGWTWTHTALLAMHAAIIRMMKKNSR